MDERAQAKALTRTFLARFFDNEMSDGSKDLTSSFLWTIALLATPGIIMPTASAMRWRFIEVIHGADALRAVSVADKALYLSMSMGGIMLLTAVVWQALLPDRRDAFVLGSFPVRARVIVASKLAALVAYAGIVATGANAVASVLYALPLATSVELLLRGAPAHFIAAVTAGLFACLSVAALQAVLLAAGGVRLFRRATAPAQLALATAGLLLVLMSPMCGAAGADVAGGTGRMPWAGWFPPIWFLGVYEVLVGGEAPVMRLMAARAGAAFAIVIVVLLATYPLAYGRVVRDAMAGSPLARRRSAAGTMGRLLVRGAPIGAEGRGAVHFVLLTLGRVARYKLILATAIGAAVALTLPFALSWAGRALPAYPTRSQLALPLVFVLLAMAGLRVAYSVPSDRAAAWIFTTTTRPARTGRKAARIVNVMILGVAPALVSIAVYGWFWSARVGLEHASVILGLALLLSEILVRAVERVPFTEAFRPDRAQLQARWPLYLIAAVLFLQALPSIERPLLVNGFAWVLALVLMTGAAALRVLQALATDPPDLVDADHEDKPLALRLY